MDRLVSGWSYLWMTIRISAGGGNRLPQSPLTAVKSTAQSAIPKTVQGAARILSSATQDQFQPNILPGLIRIPILGDLVQMDPSGPRHPTPSSYSKYPDRTTAALRFTSCMFFDHHPTVEGLPGSADRASLGFAVNTTLSSHEDMWQYWLCKS